MESHHAEKAIEQYENLEPVEVSDYFFQKVEQKLREQRTVEKPSTFQLAFLSGALTALLVANVLMFSTVLNKDQMESASRTEVMETLVQEYRIQTDLSFSTNP